MKTVLCKYRVKRGITLFSFDVKLNILWKPCYVSFIWSVFFSSKFWLHRYQFYIIVWVILYICRRVVPLSRHISIFLNYFNSYLSVPSIHMVYIDIFCLIFWIKIKIKKIKNVACCYVMGIVFFNNWKLNTLIII